jgi:tetratricopeptide (TPR) repeat protein
MPRIYFTVLVFLFLGRIAEAQVDVLKYSNEDAYLNSLIGGFQKLDFKWNLPGEVQIDMNEGLNFLDEKNYELAQTHLTNVLKYDSNFAPARYYRGVCNKMMRRGKLAQSDLVWASKLMPNRPEPFIELGDISVLRYALPKANSYYQKASKLNPESVVPQFKLGSLAFFMKETKRASRFFENCNKIDPRFPDAYLAMGILKFRDLTTRSQALPFFSKSIAADSSFAMGYYWRGISYIMDKDNAKGREDWNHAIRLSPSNTFLMMMRGLLLIELNEFEEAFKDLRKAMQATQVDENQAQFGATMLDKKIDVQNAANYLVRFGYGLNEEAFINLKKGFCLMLIDRDKDALTSISQAQAIEPTATVFYLKAVAFRMAVKHDSAIYYYTKALELDPNIFDANKNLAIYKSELKDWKGAYAHLRNMSKIQPGASLTWRLSGLIKFGLKDYFGSIIDLTKYLKVDTADFNCLKTRAAARFEIEDYKGALGDYSEVLASVQNPQLYMLMAECHFYMKDEKALSVLKEGVTKYPDNFDIKLVLAERLADFKYSDEAKSILKQFRHKSYLAYTRSYINWADYIECKIYANEGKPEKALRQLNAIVKNSGESNDYLLLRSQLLIQLGETEMAKRDLVKLKEKKYKLANELIAKYGI